MSRYCRETWRNSRSLSFTSLSYEIGFKILFELYNLVCLDILRSATQENTLKTYEIIWLVNYVKETVFYILANFCSKFFFIIFNY